MSSSTPTTSSFSVLSLHTTADVLLVQLLEFFTYNLIITRWIRLSKRCKAIYEQINPKKSNLLVRCVFVRLCPLAKLFFNPIRQEHPLPKRMETEVFPDGILDIFKSIHTMEFVVPNEELELPLLAFKQLQSLELIITFGTHLNILTQYSAALVEQKQQLEKLRYLKITCWQHDDFYSIPYMLTKFLNDLSQCAMDLESLTFLLLNFESFTFLDFEHGTLFGQFTKLRHIGFNVVDDDNILVTATEKLNVLLNSYDGILPNLSNVTIYYNKAKQIPNKTVTLHIAGRSLDVGFCNHQ
jgi:hypothetical protein